MNDLFSVGFFSLARNVSKYSDYSPRMGAVLVKHKPIGVGFNRQKTHTLYCNPLTTLSTTIHCEASAIINSGSTHVSNSTLYIYREDFYGNPKMARPCSKCMQLLIDFGVRKIYYTIDEYPFYCLERI